MRVSTYNPFIAQKFYLSSHIIKLNLKILSLCYNPGMSDSPVTTLACTQCGGELHPDEGQLFLTCPYCSATVYLDPSQVVFHWYLTPTIDPQQSNGQLNRWMSGNQTVKDLDKKAKITDQAFQYFPLWYFLAAQNNHEISLLESAAAISITELARLELPAGDLKPYVAGIDSQAVPPTVPLETARSWLMQKKPGAVIRQCALVHIPIFIFHYEYRGKTYSAVVEAGTGTVIANIYPAKAEAPYLMAGGITALVYLFLAFLALGGAQIFGLSIILGIIAAPILFFFAVMVASRI